MRDELTDLPDDADSGDSRGSTFSVEDAEDALLEGDRTFAAGTALAALRYPVFRTVFLGSPASNIGSWMQNVVTAASPTTSPARPPFVSIACFSQLGALLLLVARRRRHGRHLQSQEAPHLGVGRTTRVLAGARVARPLLRSVDRSDCSW